MSYVLERVHTDPRLRRRRKAVERTRRRKLFVKLVVLVTLVVVVWAVLWSPLLTVRHLELRGVKHTTSAEVLEAADLGSDANILRVSTDEIEERIEALPWVKKASAARVLPGTLRVKIQERQAALALSLGAAHWKLDESGRVLAAGKGDGLPVLVGADVDNIQPGTEIEAEQLVGGLRVYRSLSHEVQKRVAAILAPTPERITLTLTDGSQVRYGSAELLAAKSNVLKSLLRRLERDGTTAAYIDLRVPTSPAVSPVAPVPAVSVATTDPATTPVAAEEAPLEVDPGAEAAPADPTAETEITDGPEDAAAQEKANAEAAAAD